MNTTTNTHRSRWGYHAADHATFAKLRALHKWYWQTVYDFHRWHRWWRKRPENRRGPEPRYCDVFVEDRVWYKPVTPHGVPGYQVYPRTIVDHGVLALYEQVRRPQPEPVAALDPATLSQIAALHERVAVWFAT
jgi:hypothetical protein